MPRDDLLFDPTLEPESSALNAWLAKIRPFGFDFFCFGKKFLVYNLVGRNLKIKYRRSALGIMWTLVSPLALGCIYYFVFEKVMKINVPHYLGFVLSGIFLWNFFSGTVVEGTESLVGSFSLLQKIPIPIQVFPFVTVVTNLVTLLLSVPIIFAAVLLSGSSMSWAMLLFPVYLVILFLLTYAFSLIAALGFVYFRDLRHVMQILTQVWFYGTPVLYDAKMIPPKYAWVLYANPTGLLFHHFHLILVEGVIPPRSQVIWVLLWTLASVVVAGWTYRKGASMAVEIL